MPLTEPDSVAQDQLQAYVRRIESLEDEITALNGDKSEIYKEAKGNGFDTKVLRKVIADRRKDATERNEFDAVYQLYWDAIHGVVRAHVENVEEFARLKIEPLPEHDAAMNAKRSAALDALAAMDADLIDAETGEIIEPQAAMPAQTVPATMPVVSAPESSTLHPQPETAGLPEATASGVISPPGSGAGTGDAGEANQAGNHDQPASPASNSVTVPPAPPLTAEVTASADRSAALTLAAAPVGDRTNVTVLRTHNPETHFLNSKGLPRLHGCLKPETCASEQASRKLCFSCGRAYEGSAA
jgi:uncharacterized protein (UPF0335 family)